MLLINRLWDWVLWLWVHLLLFCRLGVWCVGEVDVGGVEAEVKWKWKSTDCGDGGKISGASLRY